MTPIIKVAVGSLGGTVSMTKEASSEGVKPKLTAADLVGSIEGDLEGIEIHAENILQVPSSYLTFDHVLLCYDWAKAQVAQGANGIVLTQGTDTLEETAFLLDLIWDSDTPLILTGAMRNPQQAGAEGPANLLASIIAAASKNSAGRGVQVVMNNWIHEARWVRKNHTADVNAFSSQVGPAGTVFENKSQYFRSASKRVVFTKPTQLDKQVFLWETSLGDSAQTLEDIAQQYDGIVISAFGAGHVSEKMAEILKKLAASLPVIVSSATQHGSTAYNTYGYVGAEIDLQKSGMMMSAWLSPKKSRLLLSIVLANRLPVSSFQTYLNSLVY